MLGGEYIQLLVGVILGSVGTLVGAWVQIKKVRPEIRKSDTESAETVVQMAVKLLQPYEVRVTRLHERLDDLEAHIYKLEGALIAAGVNPPPRPVFRSPTGEGQ